MTDIPKLAASLSEAQKCVLLDAEVADCFEWWVTQSLGDDRLEQGGVLTDLGVSLRSHLQVERNP